MAASGSPDHWGNAGLPLTTGLTYGYVGGAVITAVGALALVPDGTVHLTDNAVNYVERDANGIVSANTVGWTAKRRPMAVVTTTGGVITAHVDWRTHQPPLPYYPVLPNEVAVTDTSYPHFDPRRYGAVRDGVTDSTAGWQAAINNAWNLGGELRARAEPGSANAGYAYVCGPLTFPEPGGEHGVLAIVGDAANLPVQGTTYTQHIRGCTILFSGTGTESLLSAQLASYAAPTYRIENIVLVGQNNPAYTGCGLTVGGAGAPRVQLKNVSSFFFAGGAGIALDGCESWTFENVWSQYNDYNVKLTRASNAGTAINVAASIANTCGVYMDAIQSVNWIGGRMEANVKTALWINGGISVNFFGTHFEGNNTSATAGEHAIKLTAAAGKPVAHVAFHDISLNAARDTVSLSGVAGYTCFDVQFLGAYTANVTSPKVTFANVYIQSTTLRNFCQASEISDAGAADTRVDWMGTSRLTTSFAIDLGTIAASSQAESGDITLAGITTDGTWNVLATPASALPAGLAHCAYPTAADKARVRVLNVTPAGVVSGGHTWRLSAWTQ